MPGTQIRPLGVMIIAMLREGDMHPYEMMRLMRARHDDRLVAVQNGTFYHQVASLQRDGFIEEIGVDRDGNRPERTTYRVTDQGIDAISTWVRSRLGSVDKPGDKPNDFRVALAEAHNLDRDEVVRLLTQRVTALGERADLQRQAIDAAYERSVDPQFVIEAERDWALLGADIAWIKTFIDQLADPTYAWGKPSEKHAKAQNIYRKDANA